MPRKLVVTKPVDKKLVGNLQALNLQIPSLQIPNKPEQAAGHAELFNLCNVNLSYQKLPVLQGVSLQIKTGERIALVGKSGVGKSTLLCALRDQLPTGLAWCPQQSGLVSVLSTFHNIYMGGLHRHGAVYNVINLLKPWPKAVSEVTALAEQLQLEKHLFDPVETLSGGQAQRVAIGRAMYQQQTVFLGDEPFSAIDEYQTEDLFQLISERHQTVVLALHDIELALRTCQRIVGLKDGAIVLDAPSAALTTDDLAELYI